MARVPITVSTNFKRNLKGKSESDYIDAIAKKYEDLFANPEGFVRFDIKHSKNNNLFSLSLPNERRIVLLLTHESNYIPVFFGDHKHYDLFLKENQKLTEDQISKTTMELEVHDQIAAQIDTLNDLSLMGQIPRPTENALQQEEDDAIINQILNPGDVVENESFGFIGNPAGKTAYQYCLYRNAVVIIDADDGMSLIQFDDTNQASNFFATLEEAAREEFEKEGMLFVESCDGGLDATVMAYNMTHGIVARVTKYASLETQKASHNLSGVFRRHAPPPLETGPKPQRKSGQEQAA